MLVIACQENPKVVPYLLKCGVEVNMADHHGMTALSMAVSKQKPDVVRQLLEHGANPNWKRSGSSSPLHSAASSCNPHMDRRDMNDMRPMQAMRMEMDMDDYDDEMDGMDMEDMDEMEEMEMMRMRRRDPMMMMMGRMGGRGGRGGRAARRDNRPRGPPPEAFEILRLLLKHGADPNSKNEKG